MAKSKKAPVQVNVPTLPLAKSYPYPNAENLSLAGRTFGDMLGIAIEEDDQALYRRIQNASVDEIVSDYMYMRKKLKTTKNIVTKVKKIVQHGVDSTVAGGARRLLMSNPMLYRLPTISDPGLYQGLAWYWSELQHQATLPHVLDPTSGHHPPEHVGNDSFGCRVCGSVARLRSDTIERGLASMMQRAWALSQGKPPDWAGFDTKDFDNPPLLRGESKMIAYAGWWGLLSSGLDSPRAGPYKITDLGIKFLFQGLAIPRHAMVFMAFIPESGYNVYYVGEPVYRHLMLNDPTFLPSDDIKADKATEKRDIIHGPSHDPGAYPTDMGWLP